MSCFFCASFNHLSQNCDIYASDESRQIFAESKNYCNQCLTDLSKNLHNSQICEKNQKCHNCFSKNHHTSFCHNVKSSASFIPDIDENLLSRFLKLLNLEEQILLTLTSPKAAALIKPKQLTVVEKIDKHVDYSKTNLLIIDSLSIVQPILFAIKKYIPLKESIIFKGENIRIEGIYTKNILQLLSPKLKILRCIDVAVTEKLNFLQILQSAPNLEVIELVYINIDVNNTWPEEILKWKNGNNLKKLLVTIPDLNFNVESMAAVIKEKSLKDVNITLNLFSDDSANTNFILENAVTKFSPYFNRIDTFVERQSFIQIVVKENFSFTFIKYTLKTDL